MANIPVETPGANNLAFVAMAAAVAPRLVFERVNLNNASFSASFRADGTGKVGWYVGATGALDGAQIKAVTIDSVTGYVTVDQRIGVGLSTPVTMVHVRPTTDVNLEIGTVSGRLRFEVLNDIRGSYIPFHVQASLILLNPDSGNVAIGGTSAAFKLDLTGAATTAQAAIRSTDGTLSRLNLLTSTRRWSVSNIGNTAGGFFQDCFLIADETAGAIRFVISPTGVASFLGGLTIPSNATATTQTQGNNSLAPATTAYVDTAVAGSGNAIGSTIMYDGLDASLPNALEQNAASYSAATYAPLFAKIVKTSVVTVTIASPGVVSWTSHGLKVGYPIKFKTTGALPTGLTAGTIYYIISAGFTANNFQLATAAGGSAINTTGSQSGVHDAACAPHGISNDFLSFNVPEMRAAFPRGFDDGRGIDTARGHGQEQLDTLQNHGHAATTAFANLAPAGSGVNAFTGGSANTGGATVDVGSGTPRTATETRPRNNTKRFFIKYQ